MLQEGIYYDVGQRPPRCFSIMFLRVRSGATTDQVGQKLAELSNMYGALKRGRIRDLPGVNVLGATRRRSRKARAADGDTGLAILIGYGMKAFALNGARKAIPDDLRSAQFRAPNATGGAILASSSLKYISGLARNPATEEIVIQATANAPLAANRAIVETWKLLSDDPSPEGQILELAAAFTGFNREDGRSWIDFHDGVSNFRPPDIAQRKMSGFGVD